MTNYRVNIVQLIELAFLEEKYLVPVVHLHGPVLSHEWRESVVLLLRDEYGLRVVLRVLGPLHLNVEYAVIPQEPGQLEVLGGLSHLCQHVLAFLVVVSDQLFDLFADLFLLRAALYLDFDFAFDLASLVYVAFGGLFGLLHRWRRHLWGDALGDLKCGL